MYFFFQAEDGIRDDLVTGGSDVCSSDLASYTAHFSLRQRPTFYTARVLVGAAPPLFLLTILDRKSVV